MRTGENKISPAVTWKKEQAAKRPKRPAEACDEAKLPLARERGVSVTSLMLKGRVGPGRSAKEIARGEKNTREMKTPNLPPRGKGTAHGFRTGNSAPAALWSFFLKKR